MLKLNYTDRGPLLEQVAASLDVYATQRAGLAACISEPVYMEIRYATLLLPKTLPGITQLKRMLTMNSTDVTDVIDCDDECVEVGFQGIWIASSDKAEFGTFITALAPESEQLIYQLWQLTQRQPIYFM